MRPPFGTLLFSLALSGAACVVGVSTTPARAIDRGVPDPPALWSHDNLVAWCVSPWDAKKRGPEALAQMLKRLGFKHFSFISFSDDNVAELDAQIDALHKHGIELTAAYLTSDAEALVSKRTLEVFKRHSIHPQLWVTLAPNIPPQWPKTQEEWRALVPDAPHMPPDLESAELSEAQHSAIVQARKAIAAQDIPKTSAAQQRRVEQEADRVQALVNLARPYGVKVELYNHNGWFGMMSNEVAIIQTLKKRGVTDVGIVYNFSHARDDLHDDSKHFPDIWRAIQPYVVAVNVTGLRWEGQYVYPSQGDSELAMMKTIQDSRWNGRIGLIAEKGGDAETTLSNYILGLDWLAAELTKPGSAGPRPFTKVTPQ